MELTNKAMELFEEWYLSNIGKLRSRSYDKLMVYQFYDLPLSMQWGVYLEFADSLGYCISTFEDSCSMCWNVYINDEYVSDNPKTRQEAQIEAVKKLNDLINK